jgi:hypothetical protein
LGYKVNARGYGVTLIEVSEEEAKACTDENPEENANKQGYENT